MTPFARRDREPSTQPEPLRRAAVREALRQLWLATWFFADGANLDAQLLAVERAEARLEDEAA